MRTLSSIILALSLAACSSDRYEVKTSEGITTRLDKQTGKTEVMRNGRWVPVKEAIEPVATGPQVGKPCPPQTDDWAADALAAARSGCTPQR